MLVFGIGDFIDKFLNEIFGNTIDEWGHAGMQYPNELDWISVKYWFFFFCLFTILFTFLLSRSKIYEWLSRHIFGLVLLVWLGGVFVYLVGFYNCGVNGFSVVLRAIISSFKMFVVSHDLARVPQYLQNDASYMVTFSLVHFVAAFLTFIFIFKLVGYKVRQFIKLYLCRWFKLDLNAVHLFWGINESSYLLANSIRNNPLHAEDTIIFVDIDTESDFNLHKKPNMGYITNAITLKHEDMVRLDAINALVDHCYNGPSALETSKVNNIFKNLGLVTIGTIIKKTKNFYTYFLSDDETQNISGALNLKEDRIVQEKENGIIYIRATRDTYNEIFDHYYQCLSWKWPVKIKIVDSAFLSVQALKNNEKTLPVDCVVVDTTTGLVDSAFTSMIIGFGDTGQEAFKFLYEYSAFVNSNKCKSPFKCYAIDERMDRISGIVREKMPAISDEELSLIHASVDSEVFWHRVKIIINDLNYVVVTLNSDSVGLSLAIDIFKYALQYRSNKTRKLKILVKSYGKGSEIRMRQVLDSLNQSVKSEKIEIILFGLQEEIYTATNILSDSVLTAAQEFNKVYKNSNLLPEEQWNIDFGESKLHRIMEEKSLSRYYAICDINRQITQNISNSLHSKTKMLLMGIKGEDSQEKLYLYNKYVMSRKDNTTEYLCAKENSTLLLNLAMVEHERWIALQKLMGYKYSPDNDYVRRLHKNMCEWKFLKEETQSYDCNVVDTTVKLAFRDNKNNVK